MALMVSAVVWGFFMRPTNTPCSSIQYIIEDRDERLYVTESELDQLLRTADIHPVGKPLDRGVLQRIENAVARHPMVRTAECFSTPRNDVRVRLTQRVPLLRVVNPGDTYLIDADRKVMPSRAAVKDSVLVVTGTVGVQTASKQMADFAFWLREHTYWQRRIDHVSVQSPLMVTLYLRTEAAQEAHAKRLVMGTMTDFGQKLKKMRTFLENSGDAIREKQYTEYDLRYKGQIIGRN